VIDCFNKKGPGQREGEDGEADTGNKKRECDVHSLACTGIRQKNKLECPDAKGSGRKKNLPCSFCRRQVVPSGQSGLSAMVASRRPFFRSRIHQSFRPYKSTSAAHILQIRWRGTSRPGSGPGGTLWTSTNRSSSIRGANPRGCERMCCTIYKNARSNKRHIFRVQKRQINLVVYMPWRNVLGAKIVKHDLYLDGVSVEALVHLGGLDEVADV